MPHFGATFNRSSAPLKLAEPGPKDRGGEWHETRRLGGTILAPAKLPDRGPRHEEIIAANSTSGHGPMKSKDGFGTMSIEVKIARWPGVRGSVQSFSHI